MKIKAILFTIFALLVFSASAFALTETVTETMTQTTTQTVTATITETETQTPDWTATPSFTPTSTATITQTSTITPTPQPKIFSYPNPAYSDTMTIAYPLDDSRTPKRVVIVIKSLNGAEAGRIYDDVPCGYTKFKISEMARGIYFYQLITRYTDGHETVSEFHKFAVVK